MLLQPAFGPVSGELPEIRSQTTPKADLAGPNLFIHLSRVSWVNPNPKLSLIEPLTGLLAQSRSRVGGPLRASLVGDQSKIHVQSPTHTQLKPSCLVATQHQLQGAVCVWVLLVGFRTWSLQALLAWSFDPADAVKGHQAIGSRCHLDIDLSNRTSASQIMRPLGLGRRRG